jgi:hypothetical protein
LQEASLRLQSKPNSSCGFFLLGNLVMTGDPLVVSSGRRTFMVTPPASGALYMSARCTAGDIRTGDTVRVSLLKPGTPYAARMINIYRKDSGEAASENDPEGETGRARIKERRNASKARRDFRTGLRLLEKGKREAAIEYFDKARGSDPSDELAERIADALGKSTPQNSVTPNSRP